MYQPLKPLDIGLWKDYKHALELKNIKFMLETNVISIDDKTLNIKNLIYRL